MSHEEGAEDCRLTADEKELLLSIKSVPVTVPASRLRRALGSLVDVLCAYCYDVRITQHDPSPESAWTIAILSPTLRGDPEAGQAARAEVLVGGRGGKER